jgi:hypothetical protein
MIVEILFNLFYAFCELYVIVAAGAFVAFAVYCIFSELFK